MLLRNRIDRQLNAAAPSVSYVGSWLQNRQVLGHGARVKAHDAALQSIGRRKGLIPEWLPRGKVVGGLSFGFWVSLFANPYENLWCGVGRELGCLEGVRDQPGDGSAFGSAQPACNSP